MMRKKEKKRKRRRGKGKPERAEKCVSLESI